MRDPYSVIEISPSASEADLRAAYRRAVQRHHPDHNGGSPESARRFEEVLEAWAAIRRMRDSGRPSAPRQDPSSHATEGPASTDGPASATGGPAASTGGPAASTGGRPDLDARLAALEQELQAARHRAAREAREAEAARRAAAAAATAAEQAATAAEQAATPESGPPRPSDEELGYVRTDDSFGQILADARDELLGSLRERSPAERAADLLEEVAEALRDGRSKRRG